MKLISVFFVLALYSSQIPMSFATYNMLYQVDDPSIKQLQNLDKEDFNMETRIPNTLAILNEINAHVMCIVEWEGNGKHKSFIPTKEDLSQSLNLKDLDYFFNNVKEPQYKTALHNAVELILTDKSFLSSLKASIYYKALRSEGINVTDENWVRSFMTKSGTKNIVSKDALNALFGRQLVTFAVEDADPQKEATELWEMINKDSTLKEILYKAILNDLVETEGLNNVLSNEKFKNTFKEKDAYLFELQLKSSLKARHRGETISKTITKYNTLKRQGEEKYKNNEKDVELIKTLGPYDQFFGLKDSLYADNIKTSYFQKGTGRAIEDGKVDLSFPVVNPRDYDEADSVPSILLAYNTDVFFEKPEEPREVYGIKNGDKLEGHGFVVARLYFKQLEHHKIYLICTHFKSQNDGLESRKKLGSEIIAYVKEIRAKDPSSEFILLGDLSSEIKELASDLTSIITRQRENSESNPLLDADSKPIVYKPEHYLPTFLNPDKTDPYREEDFSKLTSIAKTFNMLMWTELGSFNTSKELSTENIDFASKSRYIFLANNFLSDLIPLELKTQKCAELKSKIAKITDHDDTNSVIYNKTIELYIKPKVEGEAPLDANKGSSIGKTTIPAASLSDNERLMGEKNLLMDIVNCLIEGDSNESIRKNIKENLRQEILKILFAEKKVDFILTSFVNQVDDVEVKSIEKYETLIQRPIPNRDYPSNHFPIIAKFLWNLKDQTEREALIQKLKEAEEKEEALKKEKARLSKRNKFDIEDII